MYKIGRYYTNKCYKNSADYKSAEQWLKDAANRGHYGAAYELANLYYENQIQFNQDAAYHAFQYATNAAEHDYKKAQLLLSHFYRYGYGCKTDSELCEYWRDKSYDTL